MNRWNRTLPGTRESRKSVLTPVQWFVVMGLAVGLLALLCYALFNLNLRKDRPLVSSRGSSTPVPSSPSPSPPASTTEEAIVATSEKTTSPTPAMPEGSPGPAILLPTLAGQSSTVPSDAELEEMVAGMSLEDKVAQMMMVGFHGQSIATSPELATVVGAYHVGGVVLVEANAHDPRQVSRLTAELQSLATSSGAGIPLFIAINHEGGTVIRITTGATEFPGNMAVAATRWSDYAYISSALAAQELRAMGINMNLAPVLDVNDNPLNPVIGTRSFGDSPTLAAEYGRLTVQGYQGNGVISVAKHFPGHGNVAVDSHGALPVLRASADELARHELLPFQAAIDEGVAGIMTAHIAVPALDGSSRPATLSPEILTGLLRQQMGYDGLILTDSLGMGSVSAGRGQAQAALEAVQAGADILLSTTPMQAHVAIIKALVMAVQRGEIPAERVDQSVLRILRVKYAYGLFEPQTPPDLSDVGSPEHQAVANEIALHAVTVLRDAENSIPLSSPPAQLLLISPSQLPTAASGDGTAFAELLRQRGYEVFELVFDLNSDQSRNYVYATAVAQAWAYDAVVFGEWELIKRYVNWNDSWQEQLIGALHQTNSSLIIVTWHNPAAILRCSQVQSFLTAYGNTPAQVAAVVAVLTGEQVPTGHLPISLSGDGE